MLDTLAAEGFNGIPVALLGLNHPIGIIFSGLFVAYLNQGGFNMQIYGFAPQVIDIIISVVIYFAAFSLLLRGIVERVLKRRAHKGTAAASAPSSGPAASGAEQPAATPQERPAAPSAEQPAAALREQPKGGDNA